MTITGQHYVADFLHAYGVTHVFFVPTILTPALAHPRAWTGAVEAPLRPGTGN